MYEPSTARGRVLVPTAAITPVPICSMSCAASSGNRLIWEKRASLWRSPSFPGRTSSRREQFFPRTPSYAAMEVV